VVVLAGTLLLRSTWFSATAVIPQVRVEWRLSADAAGWLTIAVGWGFVAGRGGLGVFRPEAGRLARPGHGRRRGLAVGVVVLAIGPLGGIAAMRRLLRLRAG